MNLSAQINQFQDEIREGYMPEKKTAPNYGEPWRRFNNDVFNCWPRIVACVNACAGMADPAAEIQAMRDAIKDHLDAFAWMDGPEGWTESCQKLQSFIKS